jgi:hypothetical protein
MIMTYALEYSHLTCLFHSISIAFPGGCTTVCWLFAGHSMTLMTSREPAVCRLRIRNHWVRLHRHSSAKQLPPSTFALQGRHKALSMATRPRAVVTLDGSNPDPTPKPQFPNLPPTSRIQHPRPDIRPPSSRPQNEWCKHWALDPGRSSRKREDLPSVEGGESAGSEGS